jgi:hypothetical protein
MFSSFNSTLTYGPTCQSLQPLPCQQRDWKKEYDVWASVVSKSGNLSFYFIFQLRKTGLGFDLDRDCKVQGTNNRDSKFRIHFARPLQIQDLE